MPNVSQQFESLLRRIRLRVLGRLHAELQQEIVQQRDRSSAELASLRQSLLELQVEIQTQSAAAAQDMQAQNAAAAQACKVLEDRIAKLEMVTTEHPEIAARTAQILPFASPAVSVITPTWNRASIVGAAIRSVQAQDFADWELLVVDDGSSDDTAEVLASFAPDARIRYVRKEHAGQCRARNLGLKLAKGQIIAYLDSDNIWYAGYLAAAVATYAARPDVDCAYGAMVTESHWKERLLFESFDRERLIQGNYIGMSTFSHRRSLLDRYGGFDDELEALEDWDLILRYTDHAPAYRLPFLAVRYRDVDDKRVTVVRKDEMAENVAKIRRKWPVE